MLLKLGAISVSVHSVSLSKIIQHDTELTLLNVHNESIACAMWCLVTICYHKYLRIQTEKEAADTWIKRHVK